MNVTTLGKQKYRGTVGGEKELRESNDSRSKYLKTDLILGQSQSNQIDDQPNHRLNKFEGPRGWWWWQTFAGVVVSPTKETKAAHLVVSKSLL